LTERIALAIRFADGEAAEAVPQQKAPIATQSRTTQRRRRLTRGSIAKDNLLRVSAGREHRNLQALYAGGGTRTPDTRIMIPLL
jgi:hypothetical protein